MTDQMDRRTTLIGEYMSWIEPWLYPIFVIPAILLISNWSSFGTWLATMAIPFVALALFRLNLAFFQKPERLRRTTVFTLMMCLQGALVFFTVAFIPLALLGLVTRTTNDPVLEETGGQRLIVGLQLALALTLVGIAIRLIVLLMEELRYLSRKIASSNENSNLHNGPKTA